MNSLYDVRRKVGEPYVGCTGKVLGVVKRKKAKRYKRAGKCTVVKRG